MTLLLACVHLLLSLQIGLGAAVDKHAIAEYKFDMGAAYGLNGHTEISHDNLQNIIKGAQKGNKDNIYFLGLLKLYGIALTKNEEAAAEYFKQAADLGLADAQTAYGIMLVQGLGTRQDFVSAEKYFRLAVAQDNTNGMWLLAKLLVDGFTSIKGSKLTEAVHHLQKAADRRSPQAEHFLALLYEYGRGVPQDFQRAVMYYKRASEQHNVESMYNLALMYMFSRGVQQDFKMALPLLQKAAKNNHAPSLYYLGVLKMNGHGTNVDYEEATGWFEKAAALDDFRISGLASDSYKHVQEMLNKANEHNNRVLDEYMERNAMDLDPNN